MDLQYISDAYACVMYITSYMLKSEKVYGRATKTSVKRMQWRTNQSSTETSRLSISESS